MTSYVMMALSNPVDGTDDKKVAEWYDGSHIPEIRTAIPGVGTVRRFKAADAQFSPDGSVGHRYLTVYEIEADEASSIVAALGAGLANGTVTRGTVLDPVDTVLAVYESA